MVRAPKGGEKLPNEIPEEVIAAVRKAAVDGKISCRKAWEIAEEEGVSVRLVGRAIDILSIKINRCELGCF
ncbi:MAG: hypothetical protein PHP64_04795 [Actinomycetota bacterium]|nr:hypothetical protein [Actinomycetota bacterium]